MNSARRISRRTVLRGVGAAVALPLLDCMAPTVGRAAATVKPTVRMAHLYFPNGVAENTWQPERVSPDGRLLKLNEWMSPLESLKEHLIIPRNMWTPRGNGHSAGTATWLTGEGYDGEKIDAGEVSVDQLAARHVGRETLLPSLELSMRGQGSARRSCRRRRGARCCDS